MRYYGGGAIKSLIAAMASVHLEQGSVFSSSVIWRLVLICGGLELYEVEACICVRWRLVFV